MHICTREGKKEEEIKQGGKEGRRKEAGRKKEGWEKEKGKLRTCPL